MSIKIGEYRLIPKHTEFWSIKNQSKILIPEDVIVEIQSTCIGSDYVFVKPMQLLFNVPGQIPGLIGKGTDEYGISYSKTLPYKIPEPSFLDFNYKDNENETCKS